MRSGDAPNAFAAVLLPAGAADADGSVLLVVLATSAALSVSVLSLFMGTLGTDLEWHHL